MFQESEIINLVFATAALVIIVFSFRKIKIPLGKFFYAGFYLMVCGYVFTVVEGFAWRSFFNFLEHLAYALSGISFAIGCWLINRHSRGEGKE